MLFCCRLIQTLEFPCMNQMRLSSTWLENMVCCNGQLILKSYLNCISECYYCNLFIHLKLQAIYWCPYSFLLCKEKETFRFLIRMNRSWFQMTHLRNCLVWYTLISYYFSIFLVKLFLSVCVISVNFLVQVMEISHLCCPLVFSL